MRQALGRGLERLLPQKKESKNIPVETETQPLADSGKIPISAVKPNRYQPRKNFSAESLAELADSIKKHGLAQPIMVSPPDKDGRYELIMGERRLRAAQLAGLSHISAQVKSVTDKDRAVLSLIENVQRDDLNAAEAARAYSELIKDHGFSQTELAQQLSKSKSAVSNTLRLLELSEEILAAVETCKLTEGHARALLSVSHPGERIKLYRHILAGGVSVRETEALARALESGKKARDKKSNSAGTLAPDIRAIEQDMTRSLGMKVSVRTKKDGKTGSLTIHFYSLTDFDKLLSKLK
jgi:ParB family chromosome partitioning protein